MSQLLTTELTLQKAQDQEPEIAEALVIWFASFLFVLSFVEAQSSPPWITWQWVSPLQLGAWLSLSLFDLETSQCC
jgi:hypothetical protein